MFWYPPPKVEFSKKHKRFLRNLTIDEDGPGTILRDFAAMVGYVQERKLPLTPMYQLPRRTLPEINARLAHPLQLGLSHPLQKSYPHIHGLYLLVRASGLTAIAGTARKPVLVVDDVVYHAWEGLNPTERYGALLEAWLLRGHEEIIGEDRRSQFFIPETFHNVVYSLSQIPDSGMEFAGYKDAIDRLGYYPGWHNVGLLELFGWISVQHGTPVPGEAWQIEHIWRTPVGDAFLAALYDGFFGDRDQVLQLEGEGMVPSGALQPALQPYLPAWRRPFAVPRWSFRDGLHVFKVSLDRCLWRRIAIPADLPLDALASGILDAYEFDHDHLYEFSYLNRFGVQERVNHPYMDEGPRASEVRVGDVPIGVGGTMTFTYDFGDWWEFAVTLERVEAPDASVESPVVLESEGEAPEQYGTWVGLE